MDSLEASSHAGQVSDSHHSDTGESDIDISGLLHVSDQNSPVSSPMAKNTIILQIRVRLHRGPGRFGRRTLSLRMTTTKLFCHS